MFLIDTHAHLDEEAFDVDRSDVLQRAAQAGVGQILTIGTTAASSRRAVELAAEFSQVFAVVGIQPNYVAQAGAGDWEEIERLSVLPRVVALGETGLDRYWDSTPLALQIDYFQRHMGLAQRLGRPFVVHCREAEAEVVEQLRQAATRGPLRGVMHSFAGAWSTAAACLDLGLHLSFSGMITYKRSHELREVVQKVPADRLLVETDAPYLPPQPVRGERNEPAHVRYTAEAMARLRGETLEDLARNATRNARELFQLPEP